MPPNVACFSPLVFPVDRAVTAPAPAHAPARVAIVGLVHGHVAGFLPQLPKHPEVQLVGVSDPDASLRQEYAAEFHLDPKIFFPTEEAMIAATHPQAVLVYTSIAGHRPRDEVAARHHIAVMVEKPLTISLDDALAIRKVSRENNVPVLVNYETTWYASNKAAHDELEAGKLGRCASWSCMTATRDRKRSGCSRSF